MQADDEQTRVRACWLYYMEGLTQAQVAERLGTTRLRVNRFLMEARASGLVGITINSPLASCTELEQRLLRSCGLKAAVVVPTPADPDLVPTVVGRAAGERLSREVDTIRTGTVGVGWGATLRETIRHVTPGDHPELQITSMMGGLTFGFDLNTFEIASELARRWNSQCHYLAAPIYAGTPESRGTILAQDVFEDAFARLRASDVAVLSIGDLTRRSLLIRNGLPQDVHPEELAAAGAVGDILGQFVDPNGRPVDHPINRRVIALPIEALADIPTVIVASGGLNKVAVIAAVLRAGFADVLVTDESTAAAALDLVEASA
jgi:DNA-binding transcriptional regulator LsrR (DeoR family)